MQLRRSSSFVTVDDYLFGEQDGQVRHEYVDGEVYAMVGASDRHGLIAGNLHTALNLALPDRCQVFISDMKVRVRTDAKDIFYYPDVLVTCDSRDRETYYREKPCLIVEILSRRTERLDRFEKLMFYRQLASLEEYVLISQDYRQVEVYRRAEQWEPVVYRKDEVMLRSVDLRITMDQLYRRTDR